MKVLSSLLALSLCLPPFPLHATSSAGTVTLDPPPAQDPKPGARPRLDEVAAYEGPKLDRFLREGLSGPDPRALGSYFDDFERTLASGRAPGPREMEFYRRALAAVDERMRELKGSGADASELDGLTKLQERLNGLGEKLSKPEEPVPAAGSEAPVAPRSAAGRKAPARFVDTKTAAAAAAATSAGLSEGGRVGAGRTANAMDGNVPRPDLADPGAGTALDGAGRPTAGPNAEAGSLSQGGRQQLLSGQETDLERMQRSGVNGLALAPAAAALLTGSPVTAMLALAGTEAFSRAVGAAASAAFPVGAFLPKDGRGEAVREFERLTGAESATALSALARVEAAAGPDGVRRRAEVGFLRAELAKPGATFATALDALRREDGLKLGAGLGAKVLPLLEGRAEDKAKMTDLIARFEKGEVSYEDLRKEAVRATRTSLLRRLGMEESRIAGLTDADFRDMAFDMRGLKRLGLDPLDPKHRFGFDIQGKRLKELDPEFPERAANGLEPALRLFAGRGQVALASEGRLRAGLEADPAARAKVEAAEERGRERDTAVTALYTRFGSGTLGFDALAAGLEKLGVEPPERDGGLEASWKRLAGQVRAGDVDPRTLKGLLDGYDQLDMVPRADGSGVAFVNGSTARHFLSLSEAGRKELLGSLGVAGEPRTAPEFLAAAKKAGLMVFDRGAFSAPAVEEAAGRLRVPAGFDARLAQRLEALAAENGGAPVDPYSVRFRLEDLVPPEDQNDPSKPEMVEWTHALRNGRLASLGDVQAFMAEVGPTARAELPANFSELAQFETAAQRRWAEDALRAYAGSAEERRLAALEGAADPAQLKARQDQLKEHRADARLLFGMGDAEARDFVADMTRHAALKLATEARAREDATELLAGGVPLTPERLGLPAVVTGVFAVTDGPLGRAGHAYSIALADGGSLEQRRFGDTQVLVKRGADGAVLGEIRLEGVVDPGLTDGVVEALSPKGTMLIRGERFRRAEDPAQPGTALLEGETKLPDGSTFTGRFRLDPESLTPVPWDGKFVYAEGGPLEYEVRERGEPRRGKQAGPGGLEFEYEAFEAYANRSDYLAALDRRGKEPEKVRMYAKKAGDRYIEALAGVPDPDRPGKFLPGHVYDFLYQGRPSDTPTRLIVGDHAWERYGELLQKRFKDGNSLANWDKTDGSRVEAEVRLPWSPGRSEVTVRLLEGGRVSLERAFEGAAARGADRLSDFERVARGELRLTRQTDPERAETWRFDADGTSHIRAPAKVVEDFEPSGRLIGHTVWFVDHVNKVTFKAGEADRWKTPSVNNVEKVYIPVNGPPKLLYRIQGETMSDHMTHNKGQGLFAALKERDAALAEWGEDAKRRYSSPSKWEAAREGTGIVLGKGMEWVGGSVELLLGLSATAFGGAITNPGGLDPTFYAGLDPNDNGFNASRHRVGNYIALQGLNWSSQNAITRDSSWLMDHALSSEKNTVIDLRQSMFEEFYGLRTNHDTGVVEVDRKHPNAFVGEDILSRWKANHPGVRWTPAAFYDPSLDSGAAGFFSAEREFSKNKSGAEAWLGYTTSFVGWAGVEGTHLLSFGEVAAPLKALGGARTVLAGRATAALEAGSVAEGRLLQAAGLGLRGVEGATMLAEKYYLGSAFYGQLGDAAAGLATGEGNTGDHLFDLARSGLVMTVSGVAGRMRQKGMGLKEGFGTAEGRRALLEMTARQTLRETASISAVAAVRPMLSAAGLKREEADFFATVLATMGPEYAAKLGAKPNAQVLRAYEATRPRVAEPAPAALASLTDAYARVPRGSTVSAERWKEAMMGQMILEGVPLERVVGENGVKWVPVEKPLGSNNFFYNPKTNTVTYAVDAYGRTHFGRGTHEVRHAIDFLTGKITAAQMAEAGALTSEAQKAEGQKETSHFGFTNEQMAERVKAAFDRYRSHPAEVRAEIGRYMAEFDRLNSRVGKVEAAARRRYGDDPALWPERVQAALAGAGERLGGFSEIVGELRTQEVLNNFAARMRGLAAPSNVEGGALGSLEPVKKAAGIERGLPEAGGLDAMNRFFDGMGMKALGRMMSGVLPATGFEGPSGREARKAPPTPVEIRDLYEKMPQSLRDHVEAYYGATAKEALPEAIARLMKTSDADPAWWSDHGINHMINIVANMPGLLSDVQASGLVAARAPKRAEFMEAAGRLNASLHDMWMKELTERGRDLHPSRAAREAYSGKLDQAAADFLEMRLPSGRTFRESLMAEYGVKEGDVPRVMREIMAMSYAHSKSNVPLEDLNSPEKFRRKMIEVTLSRDEKTKKWKGIEKVEGEFMPGEEQPYRSFYEKNGRDQFGKLAFDWLLKNPELAQDMTDVSRALRLADAMRWRGADFRGSQGASIVAAEVDGRMQAVMRLANPKDGTTYLVAYKSPLAMGEANISATRISPEGNLVVGLERGAFGSKANNAQMAAATAEVIVDIYRDYVGSFDKAQVRRLVLERPAGEDPGFTKALMEEVRKEAAKKELKHPGLTAMIERAMTAADPSSGPAIVAEAKRVGADIERRRFAAAAEPLPRAETDGFWNKVQAGGIETTLLDQADAIKGARVLTLTEGEILMARGVQGDFVYVPLGGKLRAEVGKTYKPVDTKDGVPVGELSVLTGNPRVADITAAEGGARVLAIPKDVYRAQWMRAIYTHETVLERLRNDTKAKAQKDKIDP